jgi:hypothetical protein
MKGKGLRFIASIVQKPKARTPDNPLHGLYDVSDSARSLGGV